MKIRCASKAAMSLVITASFVIPQTPSTSYAAFGAFSLSSIFNTDDSAEDETSNSSSNNNSNINRPKTTTTAPKPTNTKMNPAKVPAAYSCPVFDNQPHSELIAAIDALTKEVKTSPQCSNNPSVKTIEQSGDTIKTSVESIQNIMMATDPTAINIGSLDQTMTSALAAVSNLGEVFNNSNFLNSDCGLQTMSTGKALMALNDVINGLAPYALFAVSMNAALAPALPFVIGGVVATSGIAAIGKMIEQNTLDMKLPEHRKAILQNTCQYTKVAKKVRFMQLAQSGKIEHITQELEKSVDLYNASFARPTQKLQTLLDYKNSHEKVFNSISEQLKADQGDLKTIQDQMKINQDDLMICTLANELTNWASDGVTFPASVVNNLEYAARNADKVYKLQAVTLRTHFESAKKKVIESARLTAENESHLKACAAAGKIWMSGIAQSLSTTNSILTQNRAALGKYLTQHSEYNIWKTQFILIENQKSTVQRVEKAMKELAKDDSIVDRSELAQRMTILKAGLFGSTKMLGFGKPPVLAWIDHTKSMYDQAMAGFTRNLNSLKNSSYRMTPAGKGLGTIYIGSTQFQDPKIEKRDRALSNKLSNFNLKTLPLGSRENELACQALESSWLDWSAAIDHLGAVQFFCDMIDPVLDIKIDSTLVKSCRGSHGIEGRGYSNSVVETARKVLTTKGFQVDANLVSQKMKELRCPMPVVSVMNK